MRAYETLSVIEDPLDLEEEWTTALAIVFGLAD